MPLRARCASCAATAPGSTQRPTPRGGVGLIRCGGLACRCGGRLGGGRTRRAGRQAGVGPPALGHLRAGHPCLRHGGRAGAVRPDDVRAGRPGLRHAGCGVGVRRRHDLQPGHRGGVLGLATRGRRGERRRRAAAGATRRRVRGPLLSHVAPDRPVGVLRIGLALRHDRPPAVTMLLWPARCSARNPTVVASSRSVDGLDGGRWSRTARHTALPVRSRRTSAGRRRPC